MINALKTWRFKRSVRAELKDAARSYFSGDGGYVYVKDGRFYHFKRWLREAFPGAFIEIADGFVTVAKGNLFTRVKV